MRRLKFMLIPLLSVLGLAAAGFFYFDPAGHPATRVCSLSVSADPDEQGRHNPANDFSSNDQIARGLNRRAGMQPGQERFSSPVAQSGWQPVQPQLPQIIFSNHGRSLELVRCWQFYLRAAGEPRAPSTVS